MYHAERRMKVRIPLFFMDKSAETGVSGVDNRGREGYIRSTMKIRTVAPLPPLPKAIAAFERLTGIQITVHDVQGHRPPRWRHRQMPDRHLHQAPFCREGRFEHPVWNDRCACECLTETHARLRREPVPFLKQCWKGGVELVVPIVRDGRVPLVLFAGVFRPADAPEPALPEACLRHYRALPVWTDEKAPELVSALTFFGGALLYELGRLDAREDDGSREQRIRKFIFDHAHRPVTLAEPAAYLKVSVSRAGHAVREALGKTFHEALLEERMSRAVHLLSIAPKAPLSEIATAAGFRDVFYFSRCFSRYYGMGPRTYQRRRKVAPPEP